MADDSTPWYQRVWTVLAALGALVLAVLGAILAMKGKSYLAGQGAQKQQDQDNKVLTDRLDDQTKVRKAEDEAVAAKDELAEEKAAHAHDDATHAIEDKADKEARDLGASPGALPGGLVDSLNSADAKLRK